MLIFPFLALRQKYIYTIQLEKARVTRKTLKNVYENAFDLYRQGQYEAANELTRKILSIDPGYQDASILNRAALDLRGTTKPMASERRMLEDRFEEGMALYRQGRLVEAAERWEEVSKLSPSNLKSRYWLKKTRVEMAEEQAISKHGYKNDPGLREQLRTSLKREALTR